jgi:hypothetical protein
MAGAAVGFAAAAFEVTGQQLPNRAPDDANGTFKRQSTIVAHNVRAVGYSDLDGRPAFNMAIRERHGRWYLYTGHFWHAGWSIIDVTDPSAPHVVRFIPGPAHTWTLQMELSGTMMITALEQPCARGPARLYLHHGQESRLMGIAVSGRSELAPSD